MRFLIKTTAVLLLSAPAQALSLDSVHRAMVDRPAFFREPVPETSAERSERLLLVATALYSASETRPKGWHRATMAAALLSVAWHESRFAAYVQLGRCADGPRGKAECDGGRARSLWQLHRSACSALWEVSDGSEESTRVAAQCAARQLTRSYYWCTRPGSQALTALSGMFAAYAGVSSCVWSGADKRVRDLELFRARVR